MGPEAESCKGSVYASKGNMFNKLLHLYKFGDYGKRLLPQNAIKAPQSTDSPTYNGAIREPPVG